MGTVPNNIVSYMTEILIFCLGASLCVFDVMWYIKHPQDVWRWIKLGYALVGAFWCCAIVYLSIVNYHNMESLGVAIVDSLAMFTLGMLNSGAILRLKSGK